MDEGTLVGTPELKLYPVMLSRFIISSRWGTCRALVRLIMAAWHWRLGSEMNVPVHSVFDSCCRLRQYLNARRSLFNRPTLWLFIHKAAKGNTEVHVRPFSGKWWSDKGWRVEPSVIFAA